MEGSPHITAGELWRRLFRGHHTPFFILDLRTEEEARARPLVGKRNARVINIPAAHFQADEAEALAHIPRRQGEAVVVCREGNLCRTVAERLRADGRAAVYLHGGMRAWLDLHVPLAVPLRAQEQRRFELWQVNRYGKGCLSHVIIAGVEAVVVDPSSFTDEYTRLVRQAGAHITLVLDTHVHADHVSGGPELARRLGVPYRVASGTGPEPALGLPVIPPREDERVLLDGPDGISIRVIAAPGHTPGSVMYLVNERYLLSGDTLLVSGLGPPDGAEVTAPWARQVHRRLHDVMRALPVDTQILPTHFTCVEELDASGLARTSLAVFQEMVPELWDPDPEPFIRAVTAVVTQLPRVDERIRKVNLGLLLPDARTGDWELSSNA
ncbi:MAG: MBL fold metallo-hydrolase, partial [Myxococcota bacterium]